MRHTASILLGVLVGACSGNVSTSEQSSTLPATHSPTASVRPLTPGPMVAGPIVERHPYGIESVACPLKRPRKAKTFSEISQVNLCELLGSRVAICEIAFPPEPTTPEQVCQTTDRHDARRDEIREECLSWDIAEDRIAELITALRACDCGPGPGCAVRHCADRLSCIQRTGFNWSRSAL